MIWLYFCVSRRRDDPTLVYKAVSLKYALYYGLSSAYVNILELSVCNYLEAPGNIKVSFCSFKVEKGAWPKLSKECCSQDIPSFMGLQAQYFKLLIQKYKGKQSPLYYASFSKQFSMVSFCINVMQLVLVPYLQ